MSWWESSHVEPEEDLRPYRVDRALSTLTAKQKFVIVWRYGFGDGVRYSQQYLADKMGISQPAVWKIEQTALEKLRDAIDWVIADDPKERGRSPLDSASPPDIEGT